MSGKAASFSHFIWQVQLVLARDAVAGSRTSERVAQMMMPGGGGIRQWLGAQASEPDFLGINSALPHAN